ncbi:hypothetical protein RJ640_000329 [Escallonia rubra]|uniref:Protein kinase domain-containing protein n=1 Tax=Escallonia rubra TaxID=112253 RepID=A0AA88RG68_9ASTE|nr:hypothetical protein RJ640_000329 [Escallonia rubra]
MRGTCRYLAPEWLRITEKADVYNFGVVMLEVFCGRRSLDYSAPEEAENLLEILKEKAKTNDLVDLVDKCNIDMQRHGEECEASRLYLDACNVIVIRLPILQYYEVGDDHDLDDDNEKDVAHYALFANCDLEEVANDDRWVKAMDEEIHAIEKNNTEELPTLPKVKKPIGVK